MAYRLPKPFEIGALATLAERGVEAMTSDEFNGKQFAQRMAAIAWSLLSLDPTPQVFKPALELWSNTDSYTGRPIETESMERLSPSQRIAANTSAVAQLLGKANVLSPMQVDHLINGYFAWLGTNVIATADYAVRPLIGAPEPAARRGASTTSSCSATSPRSFRHRSRAT